MTTILLVEDDPNQRLLYRMVFEDEGYRVVEAADAGRALVAIAQDHPDLMVLDLGLPGPNVFAALDSIVAQAPELPVIIYSGYDRPVGLPPHWTADSYLVKSSKLDRLKAAVERMLTRRKERTAKALTAMTSLPSAPVPAAIGRIDLAPQE